MLFTNRSEAGRLPGVPPCRPWKPRRRSRARPSPRGGACRYEVSKALRAPLDVFVVRKLGVPGQEELAMGALASGGILLVNGDVVEALGISRQTIDAAASREQHELERRECEYRDDRSPIEVQQRTVILVDDGLATGSSMRVAATALRTKS